MTVRPLILLLLAAAMSGFVLHASGDSQTRGAAHAAGQAGNHDPSLREDG